MKMQEDMKSHAGKLESSLAMKSNAIIYLRKRIKEYEDSYEISWFLAWLFSLRFDIDSFMFVIVLKVKLACVEKRVP